MSARARDECTESGGGVAIGRRHSANDVRRGTIVPVYIREIEIQFWASNRSIQLGEASFRRGGRKIDLP